VTTAVNCDEQMKELLAAIHRERDAAKQITGYSDFVSRMGFLSEFTILRWDSDSAKQFPQLHRLRVRCGTMDLKIACIVIAHDATLLTRNTADFAHVPGLRIRELAGSRDRVETECLDDRGSRWE